MGPSNTITCQEASSHLAIGEAFRTIQRGKAELAICGGAESRINPMGVMRQSLLKRLNESCNDYPCSAVRPFDADAKGTVFGEGGGLLIIEEYEHAKKRGAKIYAELVGFAASQDTYKITEPDPSGHSYGKAIENALKDAKLSAKDVDMLVPHGLGIADFDKAELNGMKKALGSELERVAVAPIKAQIGNLGAGVGADAAAAVLSIQSGVVPPAINTKRTADGAKLNTSPTARELKPKVAVSSVYALGGQNAALVFKQV
jgi:3-oxoacyl-[acyl-carrier-protein] synthase II